MDIELKNSFDTEIEIFWEKQEKLQNFKLFQSYIWNSKVLNYFYHNQKNKIFIFIIREEKKIVAILPFIKRTQFSLKILSLIGEDFTDYNSIIVEKELLDNKEKIDQILNILKINQKKIDLLYLKNQFNNNNLYALNPLFRFLNFKKKKNNYGIKIFGTWDDYIKKNNLDNIKKKINYGVRKLNLDPNNTFQIFENNFEKKEIIKKTLENKTKFSSNYQKNKLQEFFLDNQILDKLHCSGIFDKNKKLLASNIGILEQGKFIYYYPSYKISKDINKYSPGSILLYFLIKYFFDKKINFFDFGTGDEIYKKKWSNSVYNNYELIYGFTLKGKIYKMIKIFYR